MQSALLQGPEWGDEFMRSILLEKAKELLKNADFRWAFCGGYAIDLFLDRETRKHGDIDICVLENDRNKIADFMLSCGWNVYQFLGQGKVRRLHAGGSSEPGRNLMCVKDGCSLVKFYPCGENDVFWHEFFHTGMEKLDYLEFLFGNMRNDEYIFNQKLNITREMQKAVLYNGDLPYIAPEVALMYKASNADNPEYQRDYEAAVPWLGKEQMLWLHEGLKKLYPQGHCWLQE